jgi:hypothetical protein
MKVNSAPSRRKAAYGGERGDYDLSSTGCWSEEVTALTRQWPVYSTVIGDEPLLIRFARDCVTRRQRLLWWLFHLDDVNYVAIWVKMDDQSDMLVFFSR